MIGTNAATGIKLEADRPHGLVWRMITWVQEHPAPIRADGFDRPTWTGKARRSHREPDRLTPEAAWSPGRWSRLA
jgi:hypothetical protein